jgi:hypothetical protein
MVIRVREIHLSSYATSIARSTIEFYWEVSTDGRSTYRDGWDLLANEKYSLFIGNNL